MRYSVLLFVLATVTSLPVPRLNAAYYRKRRELPRPNLFRVNYHLGNDRASMFSNDILPEECVNTTGAEQKGVVPNLPATKGMDQQGSSFPQKTGQQEGTVPHKGSLVPEKLKPGEMKGPSQANAMHGTLIENEITSGEPPKTPPEVTQKTPPDITQKTLLDITQKTLLDITQKTLPDTTQATPLDTTQKTLLDTTQNPPGIGSTAVNAVSSKSSTEQPHQAPASQTEPPAPAPAPAPSGGEQSPAPSPANAKLAGKLSIVEHGVHSAVQSAQIAANQLKTLSGAAKTAQNAVAEAEATAQSAENELTEKTQLVEAAKQRVEELLKELATARTELANSKEAALKMTSEAAKSKGKRNKLFRREDESSIHEVSDIMMTAKQRVQQLLDQLSVARATLRDSKVDYERASMEAKLAKEKLKRGRCALLDQPFS